MTARCLDTYMVLEEFGVQLTADDFYQRAAPGPIRILERRVLASNVDRMSQNVPVFFLVLHRSL